MAVIFKSLFFTVPVVIVLPGEEKEEIRFTARYRHLSGSARRELQNKVGSREVTDREILAQVLHSWELKDIEGNDVPFSEQKFAELCEEIEGFDFALSSAYFTAITNARSASGLVKN